MGDMVKNADLLLYDALFYKFYYIRWSTVDNAIEPISTKDWRNLSFNNRLKTLCMKMWNAFKSFRYHKENFFSSSTATILRHLSRTWCDCWWQLYFFFVHITYSPFINKVFTWYYTLFSACKWRIYVPIDEKFTALYNLSGWIDLFHF